MVKARKYVVKRYFQGVPKRDDFEIVEYELPPLQDGEFLVKAEWISVDPYLRVYNTRFPVPYDQFSFQLGLIIESRNIKFPVGCRVVSHKGWCDYCIVDESDDPWSVTYKLPEMNNLSNEISISAAGLTGISAYFGFLEICKPKPGDTVVVTGAAGGVGSVVGQIAKIKGCKVIGFAGTDEKVEWLKDELGFDEAFNYKSVDVNKVLKQAAPNGIDCYFDNVGGEISSIVVSQMNDFGRISVCGSISCYNNDLIELPKATLMQYHIFTKQLKMEGFLVTKWKRPVDKWPEAIAHLVEWISSGQIQSKQHVIEGFDKLYDAFVDMLAGKNFGKVIVKM